MLTLTLAATLLFTTPAPPPVPADPQVKDDVLAGTEVFGKNAKTSNEVNMDSKSLALMGKEEKANKMDFIVVHSYEYDKPGMYRMEDVDVFRHRLDDGSWNCIVHSRSKESSSDVCLRKGSDNESNEMIVISAEPKELSFVHMKGRMPIGDLARMGNAPGAPPPPPPPPLKKHDK